MHYLRNKLIPLYINSSYTSMKLYEALSLKLSRYPGIGFIFIKNTIPLVISPIYDLSKIMTVGCGVRVYCTQRNSLALGTYSSLKLCKSTLHIPTTPLCTTHINAYPRKSIWMWSVNVSTNICHLFLCVGVWLSVYARVCMCTELNACMCVSVNNYAYISGGLLR